MSDHSIPYWSPHFFSELPCVAGCLPAQPSYLFVDQIQRCVRRHSVSSNLGARREAAAAPSAPSIREMNDDGLDAVSALFCRFSPASSLLWTILEAWRGLESESGGGPSQSRSPQNCAPVFLVALGLSFSLARGTLYIL